MQISGQARKNKNIQVSKTDEYAKLNLLWLPNLEMADEEEWNRGHEKVCQGTIHRRQNVCQTLVNFAGEWCIGRSVESMTFPVCGWRQASEEVNHDKDEAGDDDVDDWAHDDQVELFAGEPTQDSFVEE